MAASLVPLSEQEHGTIHLEDGNPASRATARVFTRRRGELVEVPVYADPEKRRRLPQPLIADRRGRLPGLIHKRPLEIEATWRGRTATTRDALEAHERAQVALEAEHATLTFGLAPTIPRRLPFTVVVDNPSGVEVMEVTARDYEPSYEPNLSADAMWMAPGFGIDGTGVAYYDTGGPAEGDEAVFGVVPPFDLVLVNP